MTAEDALCDALLLEFGLGQLSVSTTLTEARNRIRPKARAILEALQDDGFTLTPTVTEEP